MRRLLSFLLLLPLFASAQTQISNNFQVNAPKAIDSRSHKLSSGIPVTSIPYSTTTEANAAIPLAYRYPGLTVCIGSPTVCTEYWYSGGTANSNLVMKMTGGGGGADSSVYLTRYAAGAQFYARSSIDSQFARQARIFHVRDYGWRSDGDSGTTRRALNKIAAEAATAAAAANGGGNVRFPYGKGYTDPIHIPAYPLMSSVDGKGTRTIEFSGESVPSFLFGTVGTGVLPTGGCIVQCLSTNTSEAVFYQEAGTDPTYGFFSGCLLVFRDLDIRTYNNPRIAGIHAGYAACLKIVDCSITNGVYSVDASQPTYPTGVGIVTPYINNGAITILENVAVSGMCNGIEVNEHTYASYLNLTCNLNALRLKTAYHESYFARVAAQRNTYNVVVDGQHRFDIGQLNIEHANVSQTNANNAWQLTQYDFYDPGNLGVGTLAYGVVLGAVGVDYTFTRLGNGVNYCTHPIGTPPCTESPMVRSVSGTYTVVNDDYLVKCNGTFTVSLPTAASLSRRRIVIKNVSSGTITVDPNGSETIDGAATAILNTQWSTIQLQSDGTNWMNLNP